MIQFEFLKYSNYCKHEQHNRKHVETSQSQLAARWIHLALRWMACHTQEEVAQCKDL